MERPQQESPSGSKRRPWSSVENQKLIDCKSRNGHLSWPEIAKKAGLAGYGKSCRERWNKHLSPHVNRENFYPEEDKTIMQNRVSWTFIATHLPGRTDNATKNRWNNHLKHKLGRTTNENIPEPWRENEFMPTEEVHHV